MRLQININDEIVAQLDKYAKTMGVSRSALCAMFIGQGVLGYNKSLEILGTFADKISVASGVTVDPSV